MIAALAAFLFGPVMLLVALGCILYLVMSGGIMPAAVAALRPRRHQATTNQMRTHQAHRMTGSGR